MNAQKSNKVDDLKSKLAEEKRKSRWVRKENIELQNELRKANIMLKKMDYLERDYDILRMNFSKSESLREE